MESSRRIELGHNMFELIEFELVRPSPDTGQSVTSRYGVNVAKVREVIRMPRIDPFATKLEGVSGLFELRGVPIPAVSLAIALGDDEVLSTPNDQVIVTEFSQKRAGFIVNRTCGIRRIHWDKVLPPPSSQHSQCINGMTLLDDNSFLYIVDLEKIIMRLEIKESKGDGENSLARMHFDTATNIAEANVGTGVHILLVDDSPLVLKTAQGILQKNGYTVTAVKNGVEAQQVLNKSISSKEEGIVDCVVSDVEMPRMDGLTLTRWLKQVPELQEIPVILHTSLSGSANYEAGKRVGAEAYVIKNDYGNLLKVLKETFNDHLDVSA